MIIVTGHYFSLPFFSVKEKKNIIPAHEYLKLSF